MDGKGMQVSCTLHFKGSKSCRLIFLKESSSKDWFLTQGWTLNLNWGDIKVKTKNWHCCLLINSTFWTSVHFFFPTCYALKTWLKKQKLLRVSGRFELLRVRVTEGKITVNVWKKFKGSSCYILVRLLLTEVYCMLIGSSHWSSFCKFSTCCLSSLPPISINSWNENVPLKIITFITYVLLVIGLAKTLYCTRQ